MNGFNFADRKSNTKIMGRKRKNNVVAQVHPELKGLDLKINEFGEIISNIDVDKLNEFLTKTVPDKKLINRSDDKYQQEFKELGLGGDDSDDEELPFEEENEVEDDDNPDAILGEVDDSDLKK